ncbi:sugar ABC transporter permease [Nitriliruptoraceae bacterium ZYF776]|nr:sugar ABC transporter permease [Profundirhabdus halotolerans]
MSSTETVRTDLARTSGAAGGAPVGPPPAPRRRRGSGSPRWAAAAFLVPLVVYLLAFYAYPLWRNIDLSLHDYTPRAFVQGDPEFVGLDNYRDLVASGRLGTAVRNTAFFTLVSLLFQYVIGLALAVFFRRNFPLSNVLRGLFLVPWLLPLIVSASTWSWMLNSDRGIVNSVMQAFGLGGINWLTSPDTALVAVTIANIWLGIPFNLVILYSGLQNIPGDLYEAASVDGASRWQEFRLITWPLLKPVTAVTLLLGLIYTLKVVDVIWIMSRGGPADASTTLAIWSYRMAFGTGQPAFSPAAAVGNLLILLALVGGMFYLHVQRRQREAAS